MTRPAGEEALDAAVGECSLNGKLLGKLDLYIVPWRDVETAANRLIALHAGVKEGEDLAAWIHGRIEMFDDGPDEGFGQVVQRGPQESHIVGAAGEIERVLEKALDIPNGISIFVDAGFPIAGAGVDDNVSEEDAVSEAGEVVDIDR